MYIHSYYIHIHIHVHSIWSSHTLTFNNSFSFETSITVNWLISLTIECSLSEYTTVPSGWGGGIGSEDLHLLNVTAPLELSNWVLWTYTYMYIQVHWNLVTECYGHTHTCTCTYRSTGT